MLTAFFRAGAGAFVMEYFLSIDNTAEICGSLLVFDKSEEMWMAGSIPFTRSNAHIIAPATDTRL
jgi:hypothetical protein